MSRSPACGSGKMGHSRRGRDLWALGKECNGHCRNDNFRDTLALGCTIVGIAWVERRSAAAVVLVLACGG